MLRKPLSTIAHDSIFTVDGYCFEKNVLVPIKKESGGYRWHTYLSRRLTVKFRHSELLSFSLSRVSRQVNFVTSILMLN